jgi:hypothetical protein
MEGKKSLPRPESFKYFAFFILHSEFFILPKAGYARNLKNKPLILRICSDR